MPRSTIKKSSLNKKTAKLSEKNAAAFLETQLERVMEREGAVISLAVRSKLDDSRRTRRSRLMTPLPERVKKNEETEPEQDELRSLDIKLVQRVQTPPLPRTRRPVTVRFGLHAPSAHVIKMDGVARPVLAHIREAFGLTIGDWLAPFEIPPSVDQLAGLTQDLWIDEIDPRRFVDQFTPADARIAFRRSYSWWFKALLPFIRWEVVESATAPKPETNIPEAHGVVVTAENEEQFTSADPERAFATVYGWPARFKRAAGNLWQRFDHVVEEVEDREEEMITEVEQAWSVPLVVPRLHGLRVMSGFFALLFIVSIPAGAVSLSRSFGSSVSQVREESQAALAKLGEAVHGDNGSDHAWQQASARFQKAEQALEQANLLALGLAQALPQTRERYDSAKALLQAGERATEAGQVLSRGLAQAFESGTALHADGRLLAFRTYVQYAIPLLEEALTYLEQVHSEAVPVEVASKVQTLQTTLAMGRSTLQDVATMLDFLIQVTGHERARTYLFIFQNNAELRPTGGFMGSLAEVTLDRGELKYLVVPGGGPYDLQNQLLARVAPPGPLQLVASRWEFQDANWFPDFPEAAKKIRWFWSRAGQPSVDGVVAVNANVLQKLLQVSGPIELPEYGKTITVDNVLFEMQKVVELEYDKTENKPKKIVGDLMSKLLERVKNGSREDWLKYIDVALESLDTKDVQIAMSDAEEESLVERFNWSGRLKPTMGDTLALIEANIAGQKTDTSIAEKVEHEVQIEASGWITDTVKLTRTHQAAKGELFRGVNNVSYLRLYVPDGSQLLEASGFNPPAPHLFKTPLPVDAPDADVMRLTREDVSAIPDVTIAHEFGRTVFGGWLQLEPGETAVTTFRYRLPFTVFDLARQANAEPSVNQASANGAAAAYLLLATSQSGKTERELQTHVSVPPEWSLRWSNDETWRSPQTSFMVDGPWDRDRVTAALLNTSHVQMEKEASARP